MQAAEQLAADVGIAPACDALAVPRASFYHRRKPKAKPKPRPKPQRALSPTERQNVLDVLHAKPFVDCAPAEVYATLLDNTQYICSVRTMYRILADNKEVRERRNQLRHVKYEKPELLATGPNQVWSWDITKLKGPVKWTYYYLYVILDIFSRYVVGWMVAYRETAALPIRLIEESYRKQGIDTDQLTLHADRGSPMTAGTTAQLMGRLGVTKSHSRPHVSNDNPFSEAQFKTLKYQPAFPERFGCIDDAIANCRTFFPWYNNDHHHSALGLLTPAEVHYGHAPRVIEHRRKVLLEAYQAHPERFVNGPPRPAEPPTAAWINPPVKPRNKPSGCRAVLVTPGPEQAADHEQAASAGPLVDMTGVH